MNVRSPIRIFGSVILALMFRELKSRFGSSHWGQVSTFVQPMARMIFFTVMIGFHGRRAMPGIEFPMFLLVGLVPFGYFTKCYSQSSTIDGSEQLLIYKQVKPMSVIVTRVMVEFGTHFVSIFSMLLIFAWWGFQVIPVDPLGVMAAVVLLVLFCLGAAVVMAIISYLLPMLRTPLKYLSMPLFWLSCLMYPLSVVPLWLRPYVILNPLVHYLELIRTSWFYGYPDAGASWGYACGSTLISLVLASAMYRRYRRSLPRS